jgi:hypothetical protein
MDGAAAPISTASVVTSDISPSLSAWQQNANNGPGARVDSYLGELRSSLNNLTGRSIGELSRL